MYTQGGFRRLLRPPVAARRRSFRRARSGKIPRNIFSVGFEESSKEGFGERSEEYPEEGVRIMMDVGGDVGDDDGDGVVYTIVCRSCGCASEGSISARFGSGCCLLLPEDMFLAQEINKEGGDKRLHNSTGRGLAQRIR